MIDLKTLKDLHRKAIKEQREDLFGSKKHYNALLLFLGLTLPQIIQELEQNRSKIKELEAKLDELKGENND